MGRPKLRVVRTVEELIEEKLKESGLTDAHARRLGYRALDAKEVKDLGLKIVSPAMFMPYFDKHGKQTDFFRVRYFPELMVGFAAGAKKPQRYGQVSESLNEVYLPPLLKRPWAEILADAKTQLLITEGERKAAKGCVDGFATMGLGGVSVYSSSERGISWLPTLAETVWEGREVFIVYDGDIVTKPDVARAQDLLGHEITLRGGIVRFVNLPPDGPKGMDDFLVANNADAFQQLLDEAHASEEGEALRQMNRVVVYARNPGVIREQHERGPHLINPSDFVKHAYSNHQHKVRKRVGADTTMVRVSTPQSWLAWPHRFEVDRLTYQPGHPDSAPQRLVVTAEHGRELTCWNLHPGYAVKPRKGNIDPWLRLLEHVFGGAEKWIVRHVQQWFAAPLQRPGLRNNYSIVVWGRQTGTGKTAAALPILSIYGLNAQLVEQQDLENAFNEWAFNKQFILGEEITGTNQRQYNNLLKNLITGETINIRQKYKGLVALPNRMNFYFTSNHADAFFIEDTDRRFFIHEAPDQRLPKGFYKDYHEKWLPKDGPAALLYYLLNDVDLTGFEPGGHAPATSAKAAMIASSSSGLVQWIRDLPQTADHDLRAGCDLYTCREILERYDPESTKRTTEKAVAAALQECGFRQVNGGKLVSMPNNRPQRLYAIRNASRWHAASAKECAEHWLRFRPAERREPGSKAKK